MLALVGCGGEASSPASTPAEATQAASPVPASSKDSAEPAAAAQQIRRVPAEGLPAGDLLPPLDNGRVEFPTPVGWTPLPRDSKYLVRFFKEDKNGLPRIEITVDEKSYGDIDTVSEENVIQFAKGVEDDLKSQGKKLLEPVLPMMIGSTACARYVIKVELKMPQGSVIAEKQILVVRQNGRTYSIELLVLPNKLVTDRDAAYALCAGAKFSSPVP